MSRLRFGQAGRAAVGEVVWYGEMAVYVGLCVLARNPCPTGQLQEGGKGSESWALGLKKEDDDRNERGMLNV